MSGIPKSIEVISDLFSRFPGIGKKSARRIAFYIMDRPREEAVSLAKSIIDLKDKIHHCPICNHITEETVCGICSDAKRDEHILCIVENSMDVISIEKTASYNGKYHVLGGLISPLDGIGSDELSIDGLLSRLDSLTEIIFAINPSVEGDTTTFYLNKLLKDKHIKISYLARGIPVGSDLEFIDEATLSRALEGRVELSGD